MGFSFDNIHSDDLNIIRVSNGDRYDEDLHPEFEDYTLTVPGRDGELYFGSDFKNKTITIDIAFDRLTERDFRRIRKLFSVRKPCKLVFDERPYKVYMAKINKPVELNYICFTEEQKIPYSEFYNVTDSAGLPDGIRMVDDGEGNRIREKIDPWHYTGVSQRIYKGEGSIEFICTNPFAKSQFKTLEEYNRYNNIEEWQDASGILSSTDYETWGLDRIHLDSDVEGYNAYIPVYNAGDIDAPFYLYIPYTNTGDYNFGTIAPESGDYILISMDDTSLILKPITARKHMISENGVIINTNNHLIEGVVYNSELKSWTTTGEIYNNYIAGGDFGKIISSDFDLDSSIGRQKIRINCANAEGIEIAYNYLYY